MVAQHLRKRYGDAIKVEYYDLGKEPDREKFPEISKLIEDKDLPVPVVAINGVPTMAGVVDYWAIVEAIDAKAQNPPTAGA